MTNSIQHSYSPKDLQMVVYKDYHQANLELFPESESIENLKAVTYIRHSVAVFQSAQQYLGRAYIVYQAADFAYSVYSGTIAARGGAAIGKILLRKAVQNPNASYISQGISLGKSAVAKLGITTLGIPSALQIGKMLLRKSGKSGRYIQCLRDCYNDAIGSSTNQADAMKQCQIACGISMLATWIFH